jgi:hypothetical protein
MNEEEERERRKIWNHKYYEKRKAERENEEPHQRGVQDHTNEILAQKEEFPEHKAFGTDYFGRRRGAITDEILNPRSHPKPISDSPPNMKLCCSICGNTNLRPDGSCPICSPSMEQNEATRQANLERGFSC